MMLILLISATSLISGAVGYGFVPRGNCALPLDRGVSCASKNASIRYQFDPQTMTCLAFLHEGCGGNENSFDDESSCNSLCIPMDYLNCPANSAPVAREDGTTNCGGPTLNPNLPVGFTMPPGFEQPKPCPANSYCQRGYMVGLCCDKTISERVTDNYSPDCGPGKTAVTVNMYGWPKTLLGKSCESHHCPSDSQCHNGAYFAFCCR